MHDLYNINFRSNEKIKKIKEKLEKVEMIDIYLEDPTSNVWCV